MKTGIITTFFAACSILILGACHKTGSKQMNQADRNFLEQTSFAYNAAIDEGNIAASRGDDPSVKPYAQKMAADHNAAMDELHTLAKERNYNLPSTPDLEHIALKTKLQNKSGREFDSTYMKTQVHDHLQIMGTLQQEIADGNDDGLKNYAAKYLPMVEQHKKMADSIVAAMHLYE